MEPTDPIEKIEFWRDHVRKVAVFDGTQGKYAEQNGISPSKLSYYKGLFNPKPTFAKVVHEPKPDKVVEALDKAFKVNTKVSVPDAAWVAAFVRELFK